MLSAVGGGVKRKIYETKKKAQINSVDPLQLPGIKVKKNRTCSEGGQIPQSTSRLMISTHGPLKAVRERRPRGTPKTERNRRNPVIFCVCCGGGGGEIGKFIKQIGWVD